MRDAILRLLAVTLAAWSCAGHADDRSDIQQTISTAFPGEAIHIEPLVVVGEHALVGWSQGPVAGRALLTRGASGWRIGLCAGEAIKSAGFLEQAGVSATDAHALADGLAAAERTLPAERRAAFDHFKPVVDHAHHPH